MLQILGIITVTATHGHLGYILYSHRGKFYSPIIKTILMVSLMRSGNDSTTYWHEPHSQAPFQSREAWENKVNHLLDGCISFCSNQACAVTKWWASFSMWICYDNYNVDYVARSQSGISLGLNHSWPSNGSMANCQLFADTIIDYLL